MSKLEKLIQKTEDLCKTNEINFSYKYEEIFMAYVFAFKKSVRHCRLQVSKDDLYHKPLISLINDVEHTIYNYILVPNTPKEVFNKIIEELHSLCDDNGIYFKYHYSENQNICTFRFEKFGKVFRYSIDANDIMYQNPEGINYDIHDRIMKMYDAARNEIG